MMPGQPGMAEKLDVIDRKILSLWGHNSRISSTALAKALRLSREVVDYRIKQMTKRGLLTGHTTLVDTKRLGQFKHIVYLRLQDFTKEKEEDLVRKFIENKNIVWVASCSGGWDLGLLVSSKTLEEFSHIFNFVTSSCGGHLSDYIILNEVKENYAGRGLLAEGIPPQTTILDREGVAFQRAFKNKHHSTENVALETEEKKILHELIADSQTPVSTLAKKAGVSVQSAKKIITDLIKNGVIFGFMPMISYSKLGYQWHMTHLRFNEYSDKDEQRLIEYFYQHPNVLWYIKTVGPWNMQISVFARDIAHYREILNSLRKEFSSLIKDYDSTIIFQQHKYLHAI